MAVATISIKRAQELPVRTSSISALEKESVLKLEKGLELAGKLNEDTEKKYVQGRLDYAFKYWLFSNKYADKKLGEGAFAIVYLGHHRADPHSLVAIKKIKVNTLFRNGLSVDAIREVKCLQELSHPNIITLHSVFPSKDQNLSLVLEYLPLGDMEMLIKDSEGIPYGTAEVKAWMSMLGRAVWFCHENFILHRDIKPSNLLIAADGEVKLADFGLARSFSDPYQPMTCEVITRWYRPPELLFGARYYSGTVDVWSMGLVFAELILRTPFLPGNTDLHQLQLISQAIGTPTEENWPGVSKLDGCVYLEMLKAQPLRGKDYYLAMFGTVGPVGVDLLMSTLTLDPRKRCTSRQVLEHKWWTSDSPPAKKEDLPKRGGGVEKMGNDLKRKGGELVDGQRDKVARKLNFGT